MPLTGGDTHYRGAVADPLTMRAKFAEARFIMEAAEKKDFKKAWQLTATGERFVEQDMGR